MMLFVLKKNVGNLPEVGQNQEKYQPKWSEFEVSGLVLVSRI